MFCQKDVHLLKTRCLGLRASGTQKNQTVTNCNRLKGGLAKNAAVLLREWRRFCYFESWGNYIDTTCFDEVTLKVPFFVPVV